MEVKINVVTDLVIVDTGNIYNLLHVKVTFWIVL